MAQLLLTADLHLGHSNVIRYDTRPFENIDQMNKEMIRRFNERVKEEDTCIIVGDFCFKNSPHGKEGEGLPVHAKNYIKQLNGIKVFVRGNHDRNNSVQTKIERLVLKVGGIYINVCHKPDDAIVFDDKYYSLNLVGHVHNAWKTREIIKNGKISLMINVGVTTNNYYPYTFDEIKAIYDKWLSAHPQRKNINKLIITKG
jgi:calcineurin-like phosphoesterase family protein